MARYAQQILDLVNGSDTHPTAEQIYEQMKQTSPSIVLATVYNNLNRLCEEGKLRRIRMEGGTDRYDKVFRHDHLVCERCGALSDVMLEDITDSLQKQLKETVLSYDLRIRYLCPDCRKKAIHS
ncbi:MAG: transcriptional repressor [Solobacterium sp.]|nr:transcriptional repressor [Solobacterium sp.]